MSSVGIVSKSQTFQYIEANPQSSVKSGATPKAQQHVQTPQPNQASQSAPVKHESIGRHIDTHA